LGAPGLRDVWDRGDPETFLVDTLDEPIRFSQGKTIGIKRGGLQRCLGKRWNPRSSQPRLQTPSQAGYQTQPVEVPHSRARTAPEGIVLTHFIVSDDVERSRRFYTEVLGGAIGVVQSLSTQMVKALAREPPCAAGLRQAAAREQRGRAARDGVRWCCTGGGVNATTGPHFPNPSRPERARALGSTAGHNARDGGPAAAEPVAGSA